MNAIEFSYELTQINHVLTSVAHRLTRNTEEAEDLYQDTAARAYENIDRFKFGTNFKAWVVTIMRNTFINNYRKKKRKHIPTEPLQNYDFCLKQESVANNGIQKMAMDDLSSMIENLGENVSTAFIMYHHGYKYDEISKAMNIPLGTVKSRIFFARQKLQNQLKSIQ